MTMTVMMMDAMTNTIVKSMYFPIKGTALEVEGISSTMTKRNTVKDSRTEMLRVIFSPGQNEEETQYLLQAELLIPPNLYIQVFSLNTSATIFRDRAFQEMIKLK